MARTARRPISDTSFASYYSVALHDLEHAMSDPPDPGPSEVRTLSDMSRAERRALERHYGYPIVRRRGMV